MVVGPEKEERPVRTRQFAETAGQKETHQEKHVQEAIGTVLGAWEWEFVGGRLKPGTHETQKYEHCSVGLWHLQKSQQEVDLPLRHN